MKVDHFQKSFLIRFQNWKSYFQIRRMFFLMCFFLKIFLSILFSMRLFQCHFQLGQLSKTEKKTSNQSLFVFSEFNFSFSKNSILNFCQDCIQCIYSNELSTTSIDSFIAIEFLFKDLQSFMTTIERFQKIFFFSNNYISSTKFEIDF